MEQIEVIESGSVKYKSVRRGGQTMRVKVSSERVECVACGEEFWKWEDAEVDMCASCQWYDRPELIEW